MPEKIKEFSRSSRSPPLPQTDIHIYGTIKINMRANMLWFYATRLPLITEIFKEELYSSQT